MQLKNDFLQQFRLFSVSMKGTEETLCYLNIPLQIEFSWLTLWLKTLTLYLRTIEIVWNTERHNFKKEHLGIFGQLEVQSEEWKLRFSI